MGWGFLGLRGWGMGWSIAGLVCHLCGRALYPGIQCWYSHGGLSGPRGSSHRVLAMTLESTLCLF